MLRTIYSNKMYSFDPSCKMWQLGEKVCIFRVPNPIMISNPEAYVPSIVSLGPYHHNANHKLSKMDQHKYEAVHRMMTSIGKDEGLLINEIQKLESKIRECYEEKINCDGERLSCMMAYDACFILEFFKCAAITRSQNRQGYFSLVFQNKGSKNSMYSAILKDIMKLENQIPLIILITALQLEFGHAKTRLVELLSNSELFKGFPFSASLSDDIVKSKLKEHIERNPCHLLDLYRMVIKDLLTPSVTESQPGPVPLPGSPDNCSYISSVKSPDGSRSTPCAELLQNAGIKFKPGKIGFKKRRLRSSKLSLREITVKYSTETLLRNLMAYEECQKCSWNPEETVISHYVRLLDDLIDSERDVSVLRKSQVIMSFVRSDEDIVRMFNHLRIGITVDPLDADTALMLNSLGSIQEIEKVMKMAREHYNRQWKVWIGQFMKEHLSKPWYVVSLVAGIVVLALAAVQTVYAVK